MENEINVMGSERLGSGHFTWIMKEGERIGWPSG